MEKKLSESESELLELGVRVSFFRFFFAFFLTLLSPSSSSFLAALSPPLAPALFFEVMKAQCLQDLA